MTSWTNHAMALAFSVVVLLLGACSDATTSSDAEGSGEHDQVSLSDVPPGDGYGQLDMASSSDADSHDTVQVLDATGDGHPEATIQGDTTEVLQPLADTSGDTTSHDVAGESAAPLDAALDLLADGGEVPFDTDAATSPCSTPLEAPTERLWPTPGELYYQQLGLGGLSMGESAIIVGPDGTTVLVDAGNDSHDDDIQDALDDLGKGSLDHVVVTHLHADHSDGLQDLMEDVTVTGLVVHRGLYDITDAAGDATVEQLCDTLAAHPGKAHALCTGVAEASCSSGDWQGTHPTSACPGLDAGDLTIPGDTGPAYLPLGGGAIISLVGVDGWMGGQSYEAEEGPLMTDDSNGENARSVVMLISHGPFRMLHAGDLTGGGSDTDPVEGFFATLLPTLTDMGPLGVDVLHAGHHGRNTSSSAPWLDLLLPMDGLSRNALTGISTAHINSPHDEVVDALLATGRLASGHFWVTTVALGGATHPDLVDANGGSIVLRTMNGGTTYAIQAISSSGQVLSSHAYYAVAGCQ